ncbi:MAG: arginine--tRNA ligase [Candidatus Zixiibacteriota bacterium]|nr:MAG: arginine--tRNA ligase [candidate division Zixibacteria bacterium]
MKIYKNHIAAKIAGIIGDDKDRIKSLLEFPPSEAMGDLAFPCFTLSKGMRKSPNIIAGELKDKIEKDDMIERTEAAGPYVNFFVNKRHLISTVIDQISDEGYDYGKSDEGSGKTVIIEYSSPNIAKPFGIGHLRSTVIGASLKNIYEHLGYNVVSINHLGDWGTQFGKLIYAYKTWGDETKLNDDPIKHLYELYVQIHQEEEKDKELVELTRREFKKLEEGNFENIELWRKFSDLSRKEFQKIYEMLGVDFDSDTGESFYIDKIAGIERNLKERNLLKESRDATIIDLEKYELPSILIRKSDDTSLYATRDLAAAVYRKKEYNFDKMVYVVGVAQSLYFRQLFKALKLMGNVWADDCYHVSFGWVKLGEEMMSTRRGNIVFLEDVLTRTIEKARKIVEDNSPDLPDPDSVANAVGIGAVIFADLSCRRDTDIAFDWERMLDFRGNSGPYIQYSHARLCSVIRKYGKELKKEYNTDLLLLPEEYSLAKMLSLYPDVIKKAAEEFDSFYISNFLLEICGIFNTYYQKYRSSDDRILSSNNDLADSRLALANCTRIILHSGLKLLGISAPEMM